MVLRTYALVGIEAREAQIDAQVMLGAGDELQIDGRYMGDIGPDRHVPEHSLRESRVRVVAALSTLGVRLQGSIGVVLPVGASMIDLDLAIALACLEAVGRVKLPGGLYCRAELGLDGSLRAVRGTFAALTSAYHVSIAVVARANEAEADASGQHFATHATLRDVVSMFQPRREIEHFEIKYDFPNGDKLLPTGFSPGVADRVQRAALDGRDLLLLGRPGSGRLLMARFYHAHLNMSHERAVEVMKIHSAAGLLNAASFKVPFRAPHHSVSQAGMMGGGQWPLAGEVSLANGGVLFLDDLPEFRGAVLESVRRSRIMKNACGFPSSFRLVATANPCPRDCREGCKCEGASLERYQERLKLVGDLEAIRLP